MKKRILALTAVALLLFCTCGCSTMKNDMTTEYNKPHIAVVAKGTQHNYWQAVKKGAEKAAADLDVSLSFEGPDVESKVEEQVKMFESALAKNPVAICLATIDSKSVAKSLETAQKRGIPIVAFDSDAESHAIVATAATDNEAAAALAADKLAEAVESQGSIGMVIHDETSTTGKARRDGFKNRIETKYPNVQIVEIKYATGEHAKPANAAKAILSAHPEIKGLFGSNEDTAVGIMEALEELDKVGKVKVVGFDSGKKQTDYIRNGNLVGAVTQNPYQMGYKAVETAYRAHKGETVQKNIDTGFEWYDKNNIDSTAIRDLLYD
ncbi:MAG: ABC transporter substrate-binding protein [Clostridia bacterium]|nr:ABC transporter substrate-binding protein [Clostridia bacterium]